MGRLIGLIAIMIVVLGALITFGVPLSWIGQLPGDFTYQWGEMTLYIPLTTAVIFSLLLSILLFIFSKR